MILRLLLKIGFKAFLPLAATLGIIFYMSYMNGGDPMSSARKVLAQTGAGTSGPGTMERMKGSVTGTFDSIMGKTRESVASIQRSSGPEASAALPSGQGSSGVYRWEDSSGATHYGSNPPTDALNVRPVALRSNPAPSATSTSSASSDAVPGMPGVALPGGVRLPEGVDYRRILGHIDEQE